MKNNINKEITSLRSGDISAYESLFRQYYAALVLFAAKYVSDIDLAREIVQDFFVRLYEKRVSISIDVSIKSYLYRSVYNSCINYLNQRNIHEKHASNIRLESVMEEDVENEIMTIDLQQKIFEIIEELPLKCRQIFKMNRFEGLKNEEIARMLNLSKRTVETQISKALKILRTRLSGYEM
ncbi:MAG: RNA polymerase sigma-70 factor [Bacteroidales bacterium]|nr:RNA polymerase sigma-70 factor [Bacteroidales bacterium]